MVDRINHGVTAGDGSGDNLREGGIKIDDLFLPAIISRSVTFPPNSPSDGDKYLLPLVGLTGLWVSHGGKVASFRDGDWRFYDPYPGMICWVISEGARITWDETVWINDSPGSVGGISSITGLQSALDGKLGTAAVAVDSVKLDGVAASDYARKSQPTQFTGELTWGTNGQRVEWKDDAGAFASKSGFFETIAPVNYYPNATSWQHLIDCHHQHTAICYAMQISGSFFDQEFWGRKTNNDALTPWVKFWTTGNLNPVQRGEFVQNHVTAAKVYVTAADTHLDLLDTAIVVAAGDAVKITATISLETYLEKVFYIKRNGVEIGSAQVGSFSGLVPMPSDTDTSTTMSNVHFTFVDTAPGKGLNTYSIHIRGGSYGVWLNQTATGAGGTTFQQERAASTIILEKI